MAIRWPWINARDRRGRAKVAEKRYGGVVSFLVRVLEERDLPVVGVLAGRLVRMHYALDPERYLKPGDPENGYQRWFAQERLNPEVALVVAEEDGQVVGYAYARLEPKSYYELLDAHAALHDIYVDEKARTRGIGEALVTAVKDAMRAKGAPRLVLHTAVQNDKAQRLFGRTGFRTTMLEMTCEL